MEPKKTREQLQAELEKLNQRVADLEGQLAECTITKASLPQTDVLFRTLVEQVDSAVVILQDGKIVFANPFVEKTIGYTVNEVLNTSFLDYIDPAEREAARIVHAKRMNSKPLPNNYERTLRHKNGTKIIVEISGKVITFNGKPANLATLTDVTARKRSEQKFFESESMLNAAQEVAGVGSFVWNLTDDTLRWSKNMYKIAGIDPDNFPGNLSEASQQLIHPEDRERVANIIAEMVANRQAKTFEYRMVRPDGEVRLLRSNAMFFVDAEGNVEKCIGLHYDITEQEHKDNKMREQASMLRTLVNVPIDTLALMEQDGTLLSINEQGAERLHLKPEQLIGKNIYKLFPKEVAQSRKKYVNKVFETGETVSFEDERDGCHLLNSIYPVFDDKGKAKHAAVFAMDITDRKRIEEKLLVSEEKYRFLAENTADIVWMVDKDFKTSYVSPSIEKVLGFTPEERMKQSLEEIVTPESLQRILERYAIELPKPGEKINEEDRLIVIDVEYFRKDGSTLWMENSVRPIMDKAGELVGIVGSSRDISDRKKAEQVLTENEEKYRTLVERSLQGVVIAQANPVRLSFASAPMQKITGYSPEELVQFNPEKLYQLVHPDDRELFFSNFQKRLEGKKIPSHVQYRLINKNGETRWVEIYSSPIEFMGQLATQTVFMDITEQKQAEEELQRSEEKYRQIVETANEGIWMMDKNYITTSVNQKMAEMLGYTIEDMIGTPPQNYIVKDDLTEQAKTMKRREQGERDQYERRFLHKDGSVRWLLVSANPLKDKNGEFAGSFGMFTDITERKNAENNVRESEERYRVLFETLEDAVFVADPDSGNLLDLNFQAEKLTGYTRDELIGKHQTFIHPGAHEEMSREKFQQATQNKGSLFTEIEVHAKSGAHVPVEISSGGTVEIGGKKIHIGIFRDITERKNAEQELRESEQRFRSLYENSTIGLYRTTPGGEIIMANPTIVKMLGFGSFEELKKRNLSQKGFAHDYARDDFIKWIEQRGEIVGLESAWATKSGKPIFVRESARAIRDETGKTLYYEGTVEDISERRQAETALTESENKFRALFNEAPVGYHEIDEKGRIRQINKTELGMLGYSHNEMIGKYIWNFIADSGCKKSVIQKLNYEMLPGQGYERNFIRKDGSTFPALVEDRLLTDKNGNVEGMRATIQDISQLKKIQNELQSHLKFFEILLDTMPNPVFYKDTKGRYLGGNKAFASEILGMKKEEFSGKKIVDLPDVIPSELADIYHQKDMELLSNPGIQFYEAKVQCADKKVREFIFTKATYNDLQGNVAGMVGVMVDLSQQKELEQQLRQSMKMEAIGRLAGGIAHDFNNLLTAILGNAEFALCRLSENNPMREEMNEIRKAGNRAAALTQQLLAFSRKQPLKRKVTNLNHVVLNIQKMIQRIIGEDIELVTALEANMGSCYVDPSQVDQVIMNLAVNARDAMPDGGKLFIRTENAIDRTKLKTNGHKKVVCLVVQDSGSGIDAETLERIFDPFFTTKGPGGGTGLGLSVVHGIVEQHGGCLTVESKIGEGTTFRVFFPRILDTLDVEQVDTIPIKTFRGNQERILLVEDEEDVRNFISKILTYYNYKVFSAENATEALKIFEKEEAQFDLVLSDVVLPDINGHDLVKQLLKMKPGLRILLSSGYMDEKVEWEGIHAQRIPFLQKPYDLHELLKAIKKIFSS